MDLSKFGDDHAELLNGVDMIVAGPPCQGFSTAGRNDPNDSRNDHIWNVARIAAIAKPKFVVIENVKGLLSPKNSKHLEKTISTLKEGGYSVSHATYNMSDHGVAQSRVRVLIVAVRSSKEYELQLPCAARKSLACALRDVDQVSDFEVKYLPTHSDESLIAKKIQPGQKLSNVRSGLSSVHTWEIPEVFGEVSMREVAFLETIVKLRRQNRRREFGDADPVSILLLEKIFSDKTNELIGALIAKKYLRKDGNYVDLRNTFNGKFRRLSWDEISPTVDTRFGQPRYFLHPVEDRGFSVRETARIQGFSDDYRFEGSEAAKYRMIGNAVPPD